MRKQKGFTLVELVSAMAIMMILLAGIYAVADSGNILYQDGYHKEAINNNIKTALNSLSISIKAARVMDLTLDEPKYDSLDTQKSDILKKIAYIEGSDGTRYVYAIREIDEKKCLVKFKFNNVGRNRFEVDESTVTPISDEFRAEFITTDNPNLVTVVSGDIKASSSFINQYNILYIMYEKYEDECFLIVQGKTNGRYYRVALTEIENTDFDIKEETVVAEYIEDVIVHERADEYCEITVKEKYYKKNLDSYTEMELSTIVHIENYRGAL